MTLGNGYSLVHNDVNILENILEKKNVVNGRCGIGRY